MKNRIMRKRGLALLWAFIVLFSLSVLVLPAAAAGSEMMELSVDAATAMPENTVQINIRLTNNPGLSSLKFEVAYDSYLTLETVTFDTAFGAYVLAPTPYTNPQTLSFISPLEEVYANGIFATLTFRISDDAPDNYEAKITVDCDEENIFNGELFPVGVNVHNGAVNIIHGIPGDIDGDRKVNNKDAILLFRYVAGWDVTVDIAALDVNCDGSVNNKDAITLFRYVAGWDVQIGRGDPCDLGHDYVDGICTRCGDEDESSIPDVPVESSQGLVFTSNGDGTCYVSGIGSCVDSDVVIPSVSPEGEKVTRIGDKAFDGQTNISSVVIPEGVTNIGYYAFKDCVNMRSVRLPKNLWQISSFAFQRCSSLTDVVIPDAQYLGAAVFSECDSLQSITLPDGAPSLGDDFFNHCDNLTSVILPNSLTKIGDRSFRDCRALTELTIPEGVTSIGYYTFENCSSLTSIILPEGITDIHDKAFRNCGNLTGFTTPSSLMNVGFMVFGGCDKLIQKENGVSYVDRLVWDCDNDVTNAVLREDTLGIIRDAFNGCSKLESIALPEGLRFIGSWAFNDCDSLSHIVVPQSMTSIGYAAFYGCHGLKSIDIHDRVTDIGAYAFYDCTQLTSVVYPEGCEVIGHFSFYNCQSLTSISIPDSLKIIEPMAFSDCPNVIEVENGISYVGKWVLSCDSDVTVPILREDTMGFSDSAFCFCENLTSITIPRGVRTISDSAFLYCKKLTNIQFLGDITTIGYEAFGNCTSLESITLPDSVTRIEQSAFERCTNLASISLPESLEMIESYVFSECSSLSSVTIPYNVTVIEYMAFEDCTKLTDIYYKGTEAEWEEIEKDYSPALFAAAIHFGAAEVDTFNPADFYYVWVGEEGGTLGYIQPVSSSADTILPMVDLQNSSFTKIGSRAFSGVKQVLFATMPSGLEVIESNAFDGCRVGILFVPKSLTQIQKDAFANMELGAIFYNGSESDWANIEIQSGNEILKSVTIQFNTDANA